jgi:hypothetical protein
MTEAAQASSQTNRGQRAAENAFMAMREWARTMKRERSPSISLCAILARLGSPVLLQEQS